MGSVWRVAVVAVSCDRDRCWGPTSRAGCLVHRSPTTSTETTSPILAVKTMHEHIDLDVSAILQGTMTIDQGGEALLDMIARTANGRLTAAEALGHQEFVLTKLYRSA